MIDEGEMDFLTAPERGSNMFAGNGFYIAQGMASSANYGPCCTYVNIPAGTLKLDFAAAGRLFGITAVDSQKKVYLGRLVPFVHFYNGVGGDWTVTHSHIPLQNLQAGPRINAQDAKHADINFASVAAPDWWQFFFGVLGDQNFVNSLWGSRSGAFRDALGYMQSLFALIGYQDPISLMRSVIINPSNPWGEFEPQNFEAYKKALFMSANQIVNAWPNSAFGIANSANGAFGTGSNWSEWTLKMSQSVIPGIYQAMSGGNPQVVRDGAVRAGGDQVNNTFLASGSQIEAMQLNPFLYVDAQPVPGATDLYYCSYFYPDAVEQNHFMKLFNKTNYIPLDVAAKLRGSCCAKNNTQLLMTTLMTTVMQYLWGKPVGAVPAAVSLVSIHPFYDYNGRSTRFFAYLASLEAKKTPSVSFLPDFDLLMTSSDYEAFVQESSKKYLQLVQAMFQQLLRSVMYTGQKPDGPDYFNLPEWTDMWHSLKVFNSNYKGLSAPLTQQQLDQIRSRDWAPLLDSLFAPLSWKRAPSANFNYNNH